MPAIGTETSPLTAQELVNEAWDYYRDLGNGWINQAATAIADLSSIHIDPMSVSVTYSIPDFVPLFQKPTAPTAPALPAISPRPVGEPELQPVAVQVLGDAPAEPDLSPYLTLSLPPPPNQPMPSKPANIIPVLVDPDDITRPDYVLPQTPVLRELLAVTVASIDLPEFTGVRPTFDLQMPEDGLLAWEEIVYSSELRDELTAKIRDMMQGSLGLPAVIENAIFDRARAREDRLSRKQVQEVAEDMAARNLSEPNGILAGALRQVHADNREKAAGVNRDLTIRTAELAVENVKFAVGQGMALEQVLIQQNLARNEMALRAALATRDYGIARVNALIAYANLQQQAYVTDAQVWAQQLDGELKKLEQTKLEIDLQRLNGEINRDLIGQYVAQFEGLKALAEFFRTDVEAAKVKGEINNQRIERAKLLLEGFSTEVDAWGKLQDGYKTQTEAALGTVKFAESLASIFNTRMNGYKTKGDAYFQEGQLQLARNNQTLELFKTNLTGADQDLRGQLAQLDAALRGFGSQVQLFEAQGNLATAESAALDRTTSLKIEQEKNRTAVALQEAEMRVQQALKIGEILVEQIKAKAAALSQLAAASQSGVSFGASLNGSLSTSYSFSRGQQWTGQTPDHDASGSGSF